mgnify:CR=1 FL=1
MSIILYAGLRRVLLLIVDPNEGVKITFYSIQRMKFTHIEFTLYIYNIFDFKS